MIYDDNLKPRIDPNITLNILKRVEVSKIKTIESQRDGLTDLTNQLINSQLLLLIDEQELRIIQEDIKKLEDYK